MDLDRALALIRDIPDYPKPGILFRDITPLLANPDAFKTVIGKLSEEITDESAIAGIEARGFIFASAMSAFSGRGFIPIRKKGKLPFHTISRSYGLEYGNDEIEIHKDATESHSQVLLVDDVLATGGTLLAALHLIKESGSQVKKIVVLLEIAALGGRAKIASEFPEVEVVTLVTA